MKQLLKYLCDHRDTFAIDVEKTSGDNFIITMWSRNSSVKAKRIISQQEMAKMAEVSDDDAFAISIFEQLYSMIKDKERELTDYYNMSRVHSVIREKEQEANDHN